MVGGRWYLRGRMAVESCWSGCEVVRAIQLCAILGIESTARRRTVTYDDSSSSSSSSSRRRRRSSSRSSRSSSSSQQHDEDEEDEHMAVCEVCRSDEVGQAGRSFLPRAE